MCAAEGCVRVRQKCLLCVCGRGVCVRVRQRRVCVCGEMCMCAAAICACDAEVFMCAVDMHVRAARAAEVYVCVRQEMRMWVPPSNPQPPHTHITSRQVCTFIPVVVVVVVVAVVVAVVVVVVVHIDPGDPSNM